MNKTLYLERLKDVLINHQIKNEDINDVISDYDQMYEDALERGLSDEEVYNLLGDPKQVYRELRDTLSIKTVKKNSDKIVALTPFISIIIFMLIGFTTESWHPGWLVFLLIPVTAIILNTNKKEKIVSLSPFVALVIFITVGTYFKVWNPTWLIFMIIPLASMIYEKNNYKRFFFVGSLLIAIAFYLVMGYVYDSFFLGLFGFTLPIIVSLYFEFIKIEVLIKNPLKRKKGIIFLSVIIIALMIFITLGILLGGWGYSWMFLLSIPVASIYLFEKSKKWTPYMPFIAIVIFYTLGYFFGLFQLSWMAFLLIPIVAVIENA